MWSVVVNTLEVLSAFGRFPFILEAETRITRLAGILLERLNSCTIARSCVGSQCLICGVRLQTSQIAFSISTDCKSQLSNQR